MSTNISNKHCSNCGAPITTEVCPYCNAFTGIDTKYANMEYPVIECKEANISFFNFWFPMIFAVSFGFFGFIFPLIFILAGSKEALAVVLICSIFALIGIVSLVIALIPLVRYLLIKNNGKDIEATVYGYMDDNLLINDAPAQIVKLLVSTNDGLKFILYQLKDTKQLYKVNSKIKLRVYKDKFLIPKDKNYYF